MSRSLPRRGRMRPDDEQRIQMSSMFVEQEVDGGDLAPALYSATIIDTNDKDEIMAGRTRLDRTRRLLDIILLRGQDAFEEFLLALEASGYDHVAFRIRNNRPQTSERPARHSLSDINKSSFKRAHSMACFSTGACSSPVKGIARVEKVLASSVPEDVFLTTSEHSSADLEGKDMKSDGRKTVLRSRADSKTYSKRHSESSHTSGDSDSEETNAARELKHSHSESEFGSLAAEDRLQKIEQAWFILSRRVTRVEDSVTKSSEVPDAELHSIKEELADLKSDTLLQIHELTMENERKTAIIESLSMELETRRAKLSFAQEKIESLERRIVDLEAEKGRAEANVSLLREKLDEQEKSLEEKHQHFTKETLHLRNQVLCQEKKMKDQEVAIKDLQKKDELNATRYKEQEDELRDQRLQMQDQMQQLNVLTRLVHGMSQIGSQGPPQPATRDPKFCISGTNYNRMFRKK